MRGIKFVVILVLSPILSNCQNKENNKANDSIPISEIDHSFQYNLKDTLQSNVTKSFNDFNLIEFNEEIFSFCDYVMKSKVSVFIIGSKTCKPCKILENTLREKYLNSENEKILIYKINVPLKRNKNYESRGYTVFRDIDGLAAIQPTTVIFSPTKNEYSRFKGIDNMETILLDINELKKFCK